MFAFENINNDSSVRTISYEIIEQENEKFLKNLAFDKPDEDLFHEFLNFRLDLISFLTTDELISKLVEIYPSKKCEQINKIDASIVKLLQNGIPIANSTKKSLNKAMILEVEKLIAEFATTYGANENSSFDKILASISLYYGDESPLKKQIIDQLQKKIDAKKNQQAYRTNDRIYTLFKAFNETYVFNEEMDNVHNEQCSAIEKMINALKGNAIQFTIRDVELLYETEEKILTKLKKEKILPNSFIECESKIDAWFKLSAQFKQQLGL